MEIAGAQFVLEDTVRELGSGKIVHAIYKFFLTA